jgi:hypothetical protein
MNLTAEFGKLPGDERRCSVLLEAKFGVRVEVVTPSGHFAMMQIDEMWDLHGNHARLDVFRGIR